MTTALAVVLAALVSGCTVITGDDEPTRDEWGFSSGRNHQAYQVGFDPVADVETIETTVRLPTGTLRTPAFLVVANSGSTMTDAADVDRLTAGTETQVIDGFVRGWLNTYVDSHTGEINRPPGEPLVTRMRLPDGVTSTERKTWIELGSGTVDGVYRRVLADADTLGVDRAALRRLRRGGDSATLAGRTTDVVDIAVRVGFEPDQPGRFSASATYLLTYR